MANSAVMTAVCQCSFGASPAPLTVTSQSTVFGSNLFAATIMDMPKPPMTFGMCSSLGNPTVASATSAANGVLTPMPCVPACASPWAPGSPTVIIGGKPALNNTSKCICSYGGVISINSTPATTIQIP
ncbi:MAG: DUF4280 domain-containing protein [Oscillospiraceae bacterium]|nr:DUF4280 domain-containing protein [Oscillospiraceae bacterium]